MVLGEEARQIFHQPGFGAVQRLEQGDRLGTAGRRGPTRKESPEHD